MKISCLFAFMLQITSLLATTSESDSEVIEHIIGCTTAGKEAVLLVEEVVCLDYRNGWGFLHKKSPDMPFEIDAELICTEAQGKPKDWRKLSGNAIKEIVQSSTAAREIRIIGAVFCDQLDLSGLDLPYSLVMDLSLFRRGFQARHFYTRGDLSFDGSLAVDTIAIMRSRIGGTVFGGDGFFKELRILDSEVQGSLLFRRSMIAEPAIFDTITLSGGLSVRDTLLSYLRLQSSKVGGELDLTGSQARCAYVIMKSEIGDLVAVETGFGVRTKETVFDLQTAPKYLFDWRLRANSAYPLAGAKGRRGTDGDWQEPRRECKYWNIAFPATFLVSDTRVHSSLCFRSFHWLLSGRPKSSGTEDDRPKSTLTFNDVKVGATSFIDLAPAKSTTTQSIAAFDEPRRKFEAIGIETHSLVFNFDAGAKMPCEYDPYYYLFPSIVADFRLENGNDVDSKYMTQSPRSPRSRFSPPTITEMHLDRLDFIEWPNDLATSTYLLKNSQPFSPLLFEKIIASYKRSGLYNEATAIQFLKRNADYAHSDGIARAAQFVSWATVGYGLYPSIGFIWFGILIVVGYYVFSTGEKAMIRSRRPRSWLIYSIDTILPIINLDRKHEQIQFVGWRQYYLYVMKIMSAVLVFLVFKVLQDTIVGP